MKSLKALALAAAAAPVFALAAPAHAIPTLQMYVEGAAYDEATETWIGEPGGDGLLHVWAIGTASAGGGQGTTTELKMTNLRMSILFGSGIGSNEGNDADGLPIVLLAADTLFNGFADSWNAGDIGDIMPRTVDIVTDDGSQLDTVLIGDPVKDFLPIIGPKNGGNDPISSHGEFTEGRSWQEYNLPDMDFLGGNLVSITDFSGDVDPPAPDASKEGIIYAFTIDTSAFQSLNWHFDLYGVLSETTSTTKTEKVCVPPTGPNKVCTDVPTTTFETSLKNEFAPYSHDGGGTGNVPPPPPPVPEPLTLALIGAGLIGLGAMRRLVAA